MELTYKDFTATVTYSDEDQTYVGRIDNIASSVSFDGDNEEELQLAFKEAVEDYLDFCQMKGIDQSKKKTLKDMLGNPSVEGNKVMHGSIILNAQTVEYDLKHVKTYDGQMEVSKDVPGEFGNDEF